MGHEMAVMNRRNPAATSHELSARN